MIPLRNNSAELLYFGNRRIFAEKLDKRKNMARPIRETPILYGNAARRFEERMKNPPQVTAEEKARIMKAYEVGMKILQV